MDAVYINSKPHVLLSEDSPRDGTTTSWERDSRQRPDPEAGLSSGLGVVVKPASTPSLSHNRSHIAFSSSSPSLPSLPATPSPFVAISPSPQPKPQTPSSSIRSAPPAPFLSSRPVNGSHRNGAATTAATAAAKSTVSTNSALAGEASLTAARGKSIAPDTTAAEHRVRELNSSFPSPVLRHNRQPKSTGAQSTTYSQPVIVRTYSGPPQSRSTSSHYRTSSSNRRPGSRASASRRIPFAPNSSLASSSTWDFAANSSNNAQSVGWGLATSLFGMARSKGKKGGFIPWPWVGADESSQNDEAKLPPLEAFSYKGFMADLQTKTDIRSDLDRIAEICARSRYCLSDKYDSHVTPHGSGANFAASVRQHPSWSKGRRKGSSSPGGPTLQAVPSDDDESSARGSRRRRGGIGGGRRRSAAYGTLETIMSSSRSSEEDKTKKKSAADIKEAVRGRAARKGLVAPEDPVAAGEETSEHDQATGSNSSPHGKDKGKRASSFSKDSPCPDRVDDDSHPAETRMDGPATKSRSSPDREHGKRIPRRPKSTAFAHAMMESSSRQQRQRRAAAAAASENGAVYAVHPVADFSSVPALLSDPALPQTTDGSIDFYNALDVVHTQTAPLVYNDNRRSRRGAREPGVHIVDPDSDALQDPSLFLDADNAAAASAGYLSGLTTWIPWMATGTNDAAAAGQPWAHNGHVRSRSHESPVPYATALPAVAGPSHAEGSLRELLKTADDGNGKQKKGKAVDDGGSR